MKTFLDLLATNLSIDITMLTYPCDSVDTEVWINGNQIYDAVMTKPTAFRYQVPLLQPIDIRVSGARIESLQFDGWETRPQWAGDSTFTTNNLPLYQWRHHATGQGWLLKPYLAINK